MKRSMPKSPIRAAKWRVNLKRAGEYKRAMKARDGSQGAASKVRKIDPITGLEIVAIDECTKKNV